MGQVKTKSLIRDQVDKKRVCAHCKKSRSIDDYYVNKDWVKQDNKDIWCKTCLKKITRKEDMRRYFWENNKYWNDGMWRNAVTKAEDALRDDAVFAKADPEQMAKMMEERACAFVISIMSQYYKYEDHSDSTGNPIAYDMAVMNGVSGASDEDLNVKVYSKEFNGRFTKSEIEWLETYYGRLESDYNFDTENVRDYARKVCKASLQVDKAQDDYAAGRISINDLKNVMNAFDMLCKSANFAACKRKAGDTSGLTSWSETTLKLETTGHTMQNPVHFERDDVDALIEELAHIGVAIGLDSK